MSNPFTGMMYFLQGLGLIKQPGIRRYIIIPLLINILIFSLGFWFALSQFDAFIDWALSSLPDWLSWLKWILWPLFVITFYGLVFYSFSIIANFVAAPFNGPLATAVEKHLTGHDSSVPGRTFMQEVTDSIGNELIKLRYSLYLMMPLAFLSLMGMVFPLISPLVAVLWLLYTAWILTLEYAEFPMGNHAMTFRDIRSTLAARRLLSLGFGGSVLLATMIPLVNFLVMPVAVAGATRMYIEQFQDPV